jgi:membrane protease subunit HflC
MTAHQVRFTETAVVTRFDKVRDVIPANQAGLIFTYPWPIERVQKFDARLRTLQTEFSQLSTEDQKTITVAAFATWRIADAELFLRAVGREEAADSKIGDLLKNTVSNVLRRYPLAALVNTDPAQMKFDQVEHDILTGLAGEAQRVYGIAVAMVGIERLGLPAENTREVFERMKAGRQKIADAYVAEGDALARKIRSDAEQVANSIVTRAEAYAKKLRGEGDAKAAQYYSIFEKNAKLSEFLKSLEALGRILRSGKSTLILNAQEFEPFKLLAPESAAEQKAESVSQGRPPPAGDEQ